LAANKLGIAVFRCLMHLCTTGDANKDGFHERWLKRLDLLVAGFEAEKPPSSAEMAENGILPIGPELDVILENFKT